MTVRSKLEWEWHLVEVHKNESLRESGKMSIVVEGIWLHQEERKDVLSASWNYPLQSNKSFDIVHPKDSLKFNMLNKAVSFPNTEEMTLTVYWKD